MCDPVLKDLSRYERQVDADEAHDEWVDRVINPVLTALQDYDPSACYVTKQHKAAAVIAACEELKRTITESLYEGVE